MRHWILPALCAFGIHAALFKLDLEWTRPAFSVTESRAVTLSLLEAPSRTDFPKPIEPLAPPRAEHIQALPALRPLPRPAPKPDPAPLPVPPLSPDRREQSPPEPKEIDSAEPAEVHQNHPANDESLEIPREGTSPDSPAHGPDRPVVLTSVPLYALNPPPPYPALARRRNYQGTVLLDVLVNSQGGANQVKVAQSSGYPVLDQSAVESVRRWRFEPARRFGQPIEMWVQVPVRFALE
ncbi:MAG: energy transducer TonB [Desulfobacteraceae bacterium]|nr:MAG: energy transducer TonB [Desulfobacteraceae bacterium]